MIGARHFNNGLQDAGGAEILVAVEFTESLSRSKAVLETGAPWRADGFQSDLDGKTEDAGV